MRVNSFRSLKTGYYDHFRSSGRGDSDMIRVGLTDIAVVRLDVMIKSGLTN